MRRWLRRRSPGGTIGDEPTGDKPGAVAARSPFFDHEWYGAAAGVVLSPGDALRHYLEIGRHRGLTPHPLFDPVTVAAALDMHDRGDERDPLVAYVEDQSFGTPTHPLFDPQAYLEVVPEAADHPWGPLGHYLERGRGEGRSPVVWWPGDEDLIRLLRVVAAEWHQRQVDAQSMWRGEAPPEHAPAPPGADASVHPRDRESKEWSVITVVDGRDPLVFERLAASLTSLRAQTDPWEEVLVVPVGAMPTGHCPEERVRLLDPAPSAGAAYDRGVRAAAGSKVAFLSAGDAWHPGRLNALRHAMTADSRSWAYDAASRTDDDGVTLYANRAATPTALAAGLRIPLGTVVAERALADLLGFDHELPAAAGHDFILRLSKMGPPAHLPELGVQLAPSSTHAARASGAQMERAKVEGWHDVVLGRHLVQWSDLADLEVDDGVAVVVTHSNDLAAIRQTIDSVTADTEHGSGIAPGELLVVDRGSGLVATCVLAALAARHQRLTLLHSPGAASPALATSIALRSVRCQTVVFLEAGCRVRAGWLEPLVSALTGDDVLAAQSLLISPTGTISSAGSAFPRGGGLPYPFLQDFPIEDAATVERVSFQALDGGALAMRRSDMVALRGFDPLFRAELADADLCLRLGELRPGALVVRSDSVVQRDPQERPGRRRWLDRRLFLDRWGDRLPGDDARLWQSAGYRTTGHSPVDEGSGPRDRRLWMHEPRVARTRCDISEVEPRLRWAIKNPAPAGAAGEQWGDTHFARDLACALRRLGQEVVVDHRPASERSTGWHDDVVLVLRGRALRTPARDQVNLLWLISHPEMLHDSEWRGYDRMYAASTVWARRFSAETGSECVPLLQCTNPEVFHPDVAAPDSGSPVLFVGNSRGERRPMVMWALAAGLPLDVYGAGWDGVVPPRLRRATYLSHDAVGAAYRSAGVVLNDHWEDMRRDGFLSNRLFDAVAAGARVVSDDVLGLEGVFGSAVQVARSAGELAAIVGGDRDVLFGSDRERRARAAYVHRDHSFDARARTLLDDAVEVIRRRGLGEGT